jgi:hypothetical protein
MRKPDPNYIKAPIKYEGFLNRLLSGQRTAIEDVGSAALIGRINKTNNLFNVQQPPKTAQLNQDAKIVRRTPKYVLIKVTK